MVLRDWKRGKYHSWIKRDGVSITNYGTTQLYPFIQLGKNYSTKKGKYDGYRIMRHGIHTTEMICQVKTRKEALECAKKYMAKH
ncbi:MAG: hypothetical protein AABY22_07395 [Nanoarchaeota archaeon]